MSDFNFEHNRLVWFDIPVVDLDRAVEFYKNVLAVNVQKESFEEYVFAVIEHDQGNGGCLVPMEDQVTDKGIMVYMNVDGRLGNAVEQVTEFGGRILQEPHSIGPHGFRAIVLDSEGNRIVLHSNSHS